MSKKIRLDALLVKRGIFSGRDEAKRAIMAGMIFIKENRATKGGQTYQEDIEIILKGKVCPYVSRGGLKLEKALKTFNIKLSGKIALDIGASTGGFTDCMLQHDVKKVYAVDVGYGQLAWKLRQDERVINIERFNARYIAEKDVADKMDFVSIDVSFISLSRILPPVEKLLKSDGEIVALVKPQFEAGKNQVGKGGVIRDKNVHTEVLSSVFHIAETSGFIVKGLDYSPVQGPSGNIEFLLYLKKKNNTIQDEIFNIKKIEECVLQAHGEFTA